MDLALVVATMQVEKGDPYPGDMGTWIEKATGELEIHICQNTPESNLGLVASYQNLYENSDADILCYLHDDVICREDNWDERVLKEFEDPPVGLIGFGGGRNHGHPDLYKTPYQLQQLARSGYLSNVDDAEVHGQRFTGACDVSVLDGFALIVRRRLLDRMGGWPVDHLRFHCYDYAACAFAHRFGYRVRVVGIRCHHSGGRSSTTKEYQQWAERQNLTDAEDHQQSHRWFYDEFRDVMPFSCP